MRLWIENRNFDTLWFFAPGLLCFLIYIPAFYFPELWLQILTPIFVVLFGTTHTWFTYQVRSQRKWPFILSIAIAILFFAPVFFLKSNESRNSLMAIYMFIAYLHIFRQHLGLIQMYNKVQSRSFSKTASKIFSLGFFGTYFSSWVWISSSPDQLKLVNSNFNMIPFGPIPKALAISAIFVSTSFLILGLCLFFRESMRQKRSPPWTQVALCGMAITIQNLPFFFLPLHLFALQFIAVSIYHDVQYMAFVRTFEKSFGALKVWHGFGVALVFSVLLFVLDRGVKLTFPFTLLHVVGMLHFAMDAMIWRTRFNPNLHQFAQAQAR